MYVCLRAFVFYNNFCVRYLQCSEFTTVGRLDKVLPCLL